MESGRTPEYASIWRCEISLSSDGSFSPMVVMAASVAEQHLGEPPADQHGALLVRRRELRDHVGLAAALILVDDPAARAHAHAATDRLEELELHLRVQSRVHDVAAVPETERLVAEQRGVGDGAAERRRLGEPRVMIIHRVSVGLDVLRRDEVLVGDELFAHLQRLVRELPELDHAILLCRDHGLRAAGQAAVTPPSTGSATPVTKDA